MTIRGLLHGIGYALAGALFVAVALAIWLGMAVSAVWNAVYADRAKARRWRRTPGLGEALPGLPAWTERERQVAALLTAIATLPVERFDTFDPSGVVGWRPLNEAAADAPRTVRAVVETVRGSASRAVVRRAGRDRPEGGEDYILHNAWLPHEPHWEAAERAVVAGTIAILLEGHLDEATRLDWTGGVTRLSDGTAARANSA
jgi:hypothetical protein